jgi:hypothetical protein
MENKATVKLVDSTKSTSPNPVTHKRNSTKPPMNSRGFEERPDLRAASIRLGYVPNDAKGV